MTKNENQTIFGKFLARSKWKKGVPAVCKPCWEIKYCPYGPLVEDFPLKETRDYMSCRIFGHDCPVYSMAEPFTETKELRRVTRAIPQSVQINVIARDGKVCAMCGENISPEEVQFDHIIPYSKGGSSDESNIRVLCEECNKKRSNNFEAEKLIVHSGEQLTEHYSVDFVELFIDSVDFAHLYKKKHRKFPSAKDYSEEFHDGSVTPFEEAIATSVEELAILFCSKKPTEMTSVQFKAFKVRWGFVDGKIYLLQDIIEEFDELPKTMLTFERYLLARLGWYVKETPANYRKWLKT